MKPSILVTGAAGFIGRCAREKLLSKGYEVHAVFNRKPSEEDCAGLASWKSGGVTPDSLKSFPETLQTIYHCAGSGSVAQSLKDPGQDFQNNVLTTQAVLEFARSREGDVKVVFPSSAGVYGVVEKLPISVNAPLRPVSPYGDNKLICERLAQQYGKYFNVPVAIVRLFSIYGPKLRKQLLWDASNKLSNGEALFYGTGEETRDWLHVSDATELMLMASEIAKEDAPILNGGSGEAVPIRTIVGTLAKKLECSHEVNFNGVTRAGDPKHYAADLTEAFALGWKPKIPLSQGIDEYAAWFRDNATVTPQISGS